MTLFFCTQFDSYYASYGLTMFHSLCRHHEDFRLYVLCLDDDVHTLLTNLQETRLIPIRLMQLEAFFPELSECKKKRSVIEYYFTLSPFFPLMLLSLHKEINFLAQVDADILFFRSASPLFDEVANHSILITPHDFSKDEKKIASLYGTFNISFQIFRNNRIGLTCLQKWKSQCLDWCYDLAENGRFADQKYLDEWPSLYGKELIVTEDRSAGIAPWNVKNRKLTLQGDHLYADKLPVLFVHYQGFRFLGKHWIMWPFWNNERIPPAIWQYLIQQYRTANKDADRKYCHCRQYAAREMRIPLFKLPHDKTRGILGTFWGRIRLLYRIIKLFINGTITFWK